MKKRLYFLYGMLLVMLPASVSLAQGIVGESEAFIFDTRPYSVPISDIALVIAVLLIVGYSLMRYFRQRKNAAA